MRLMTAVVLYCGFTGAANRSFSQNFNYKFQVQMKSRLSKEIKQYMDEEKTTKSYYKKQGLSNLMTYSTCHQKTLKRSESSSTLRCTNSEISIIQDRYKNLQKNYRELLEVTKQKGQLFRKQKQQIERYKFAHQKDQKEIAQLRSLLQIAHKSFSSNKSLQQNHGESYLKRPQKYGSSSSLPKDRVSPIKTSQLINMSKDFSNYKTSSALKKTNSRIRETEGKGQFNKYKFIPSLPLH